MLVNFFLEPDTEILKLLLPFLFLVRELLDFELGVYSELIQLQLGPCKLIDKVPDRIIVI